MRICINITGLYCDFSYSNLNHYIYYCGEVDTSYQPKEIKYYYPIETAFDVPCTVEEKIFDVNISDDLQLTSPDCKSWFLQKLSYQLRKDAQWKKQIPNAQALSLIASSIEIEPKTLQDLCISSVTKLHKQGFFPNLQAVLPNDIVEKLELGTKNKPV